MKLLQLTATFGCLDGETLTFSPGMTLIGAPNGSGKSTWCAFLRTMLYGLDTRQRDKKGVPADKNRYRPWNGKPMEGLLLCEYRGEVIEVRRTSASGTPMGDFSARYADSGLPVPGLTGENLGEILTGVSRDVFDRSVFLKQTGLAVSQSQELERRIAALVSSGQEDVSWTEADQQLRTWQRRRRFHKSGLLPQLEQEAETLRETRQQTQALREELDDLQTRSHDLRKQMAHWDSYLALETDKQKTLHQQQYAQAAAELDAAEYKLKTLREQPDTGDTTPEYAEELAEDAAETRADLQGRSRMMGGFVTVIILLTLLLAAVYAIPRYVVPRMPTFPLDLPLLPLPLLAIAACALWLLVLLFAVIKAVCDRKDRRELEHLLRQLHEARDTHAAREQAIQQALQQKEQAKRLFEAVSQQSGSPYLPPEADACRASLHAAEQDMARIQGQLSALGDPVWLDAQLDSVQEKAEALQADYDALDIALEALQEADDCLQARFSPRLSEKAGEYFSRLTRGQYTKVSLTRSLDVAVREGSSLSEQPLSHLSQGTADQLYLALRLAVADLVLPQPDACPLILDDALLTFDDNRLQLAAQVLLELAQERQVILFTCQHREFALLEGKDGVFSLPQKDF